jgi:polyhydroxybutyrate depolymerase
LFLRVILIALFSMLATNALFARERLYIAAELEPGTLLVDGMIRHFYLHRPNGFADAPLPTIIALHGGGERTEAIGLARRLKLGEQGTKAGFVTVYPQGIGNNWNDARNASHEDNLPSRNANDIGFLTALIRQLIKTGIAAADRVYIVGASNGGMMAMTLLCQARPNIAGIMIFTANAPVELKSRCPGPPIPVAIVNGTADPLIPWSGGPITAGLGPDRGHVLSTDETVAIWRQRNGCSDKMDITRLPDRSADEITTDRLHWPECEQEASVTLFRMNGAGHRYPGSDAGKMESLVSQFLGHATQDFQAADLIWGYFNSKMDIAK